MRIRKEYGVLSLVRKKIIVKLNNLTSWIWMIALLQGFSADEEGDPEGIAILPPIAEPVVSTEELFDLFGDIVTIIRAIYL